MKLYVAKKEPFQIITEEESIDDAWTVIAQKEKDDKNSKIYVPEAYDIVDEDHHTVLLECPVCHKRKARNEMIFTHDCHGIPYRLVCYGCYQSVMQKGYDGVYYTEADECIDSDY